MSQTTPPGAPNPAGNGNPPPPPLVVEIQYAKDVSFEVPGAPQIFATLREQPRVNLDVDLEVKQLQQGANVFEVALMLRVEARAGEAVCYIAELTYCGVFTLNLPPEHAEQVLWVDCPRLLFPYARSVLSEVSGQGGFPALMLPPIDVAQMIHAKRQQAQAQPVGTA
ncbi:MAG: protein-export chaperone SecB [Rubritepida sp.]|jgi:preprotein translocase subunit SecB|nr:protein-export chaperone SecB [Rubritepida sp.]MCU0943948.1 protein-export chaperone SecB [Rubritepida sp.]